MKHRNQMDVPVKTFTHWEQTKEGSMPLSIETQLQKSSNAFDFTTSSSTPDEFFATC